MPHLQVLKVSSNCIEEWPEGLETQILGEFCSGCDFSNNLLTQPPSSFLEGAIAIEGYPILEAVGNIYDYTPESDLGHLCKAVMMSDLEKAHEALGRLSLVTQALILREVALEAGGEDDKSIHQVFTDPKRFRKALQQMLLKWLDGLEEDQRQKVYSYPILGASRIRQHLPRLADALFWCKFIE